VKPFYPFPKPQLKATFLARPQRFLVEARLADGSKTLVYCANPGSFKDCLKPGSPVLLWDSSDANRKRRYTLRAIKHGRHWVGTDTHLANRLVEKALLEHCLPGLEGYDILTREPRDKKGTRLDFHLAGPEVQCFLEVKSATVVSGTCARYPDSKTLRTLEQLRLLANKVKAGHRAILLFLVQRGDVDSFAFNRECDPVLTRAFDRDLSAGVEVFAIKHVVTARGLSLPFRLPTD
jgi:sugar fermentation stimulation protein A